MRRLLIAAALLSGLCAPLSPPVGRARQAAGLPALNKAQWREDLRYFAAELPKRHKNAFHAVSREQFERAVAELDAAIPTLEDHQVVVGLMRLAALIGDAHTYVRQPPLKLCPLVLYWFGKELRVVRALPEYKRALGARVVKIGGAGVEEVAARVRVLQSQGENEWFFLETGPPLMTRPEVLHALGVVPDAGRASYTLADEQGGQFTLDIPAVPFDPQLGSRMLGAAESEPLYRQRPAEGFWFTYLPDAQAVYVNFRKYDSLGEHVRKLFELVDANPTRKLIIDLRQNGGGDFTKVRENFIPAVKRHAALNRKGHLFVLTGRRTFSAAMTNAVDFRKETEAILVGEPPGERPNSYQENDEMRLPNSRLVVSYSTRYYKFLDEDVPALMPDKRIDPSWEEYRAGRDPALDWILAYRAE